MQAKKGEVYTQLQEVQKEKISAGKYLSVLLTAWWVLVLGTKIQGVSIFSKWKIGTSFLVSGEYLKYNCSRKSKM